MPKMFVYSYEDVFDIDSRSRVAAELTELGIACERLANSDRIKRGVWVFFNTVPPGHIFSAGRVAASSPVALVAYALEGGLDDTSRTRFIADATGIINRYAKPHPEQRPVFVTLHETPGRSWGMYGKPITLESLRTVEFEVSPP